MSDRSTSPFSMHRQSNQRNHDDDELLHLETLGIVFERKQERRERKKEGKGMTVRAPRDEERGNSFFHYFLMVPSIVNRETPFSFNTFFS